MIQVQLIPFTDDTNIVNVEYLMNKELYIVNIHKNYIHYRSNINQIKRFVSNA